MTEAAATAATLERKLRAAFDPEALEVIDESEQHRGHGGWRDDEARLSEVVWAWEQIKASRSFRD